jgi:hypothetical protein
VNPESDTIEPASNLPSNSPGSGEKHKAHKAKIRPKKSRRDFYSFTLLIIMLIVALGSTIGAFIFGQRALEGVNSVPVDGSLPKRNPKEATKNPKQTAPKPANSVPR